MFMYTVWYMNPAIRNHLKEVLQHLYINPLEMCNLRCAICYTRKTSPILSSNEIERFVERYQKAYQIKTITFCGGEVFTLPYFTRLVNKFVSDGIFIQVITNGTVDRLDEFLNPNDINMIVSVDGQKEYHDKNRGAGNFDKSIAFLKKARSLGFHTEVFSIVTKENYDHIDQFENNLFELVGVNFPVTYHPRKPPAYLLHHPVSNIYGRVDGFNFLEKENMIKLMKEKKTFPPKELGCYQIAIVSNGSVYACCEGTTPIGTMQDTPETLMNKMKERLLQWEKLRNNPACLGCTSPDFVCGIKEYLAYV